MTLPFFSSSRAHGAEVVRDCQDHLEKQGYGFRLVRFREFDPDDLLAAEEELTDKQLEVVRVAFSMGYYETPRNCTLADLAEVFGISKAAVHMRLRAAERKIVRKYV